MLTKSASLLVVVCMIIAAQSGCYSTGAQPQQTFKAPFGGSGYAPYQNGFVNQQPAFGQQQYSGNFNFGSNNAAGFNSGMPAIQSGWQKLQSNNPFSFAKSSC